MFKSIILPRTKEDIREAAKWYTKNDCYFFCISYNP